MWAGRKKKASEIIYMLDNDTNKFIKDQKNFSPALCKAIDEIVVNAIDHFIRYPRLVKNIRISIDEKSGKITIENDGPGIPVYVAALIGDPIDKMDIKEYKNIKEAERDNIPNLYKIKWNPQVLTEHPFTGCNYKDTSNEIHVSGGTNGIGMKVVNYYSKLFEVETVDSKRKLHYYQKFEKGTNIIKEPEIEKTKSASFTKISFIPDYKELGYDTSYRKINDIDKNILYKLIETRAYQAAVYAAPAKVHFQNELIPINSLLKLVEMHTPPCEKEADTKVSCDTEAKINVYSTVLKPSRPAMDLEKYTNMSKSRNAMKVLKRIDWDWTLCITPNVGSDPYRYSIMNGVFIPSGAHLSYIEKLLIEQLRSKAEKTVKDTGKQWRDSYITNNMNIFIQGAIDCPSFDSQSKSNLKEQRSKFEGYQLRPKDVKGIWNLLEDYVLAYALGKYDSSKTKNKTRIGDVANYKPAELAGKKSSEKRCLFVPEGNSAMELIDQGLSKKIAGWEWKTNGIFSIQGVPLNARRFTKVVHDKLNNETRILPLKKLNNNERLTSLAAVLGLDYKKKYKFRTKLGDEEFRTLRYDCIIAAVDQDLDGVGNIFTLLISFISHFWPDLIKRSFVKRLNTPIIRAVSKSANSVLPNLGRNPNANGRSMFAAAKERGKNKGRMCKSFYYFSEFDEWQNQNFDSSEEMLKMWDVEYFKGLAATSGGGVEYIFDNAADTMLVYEFTKKSEEYFEIYLGRDSNKRKKELKTPELYEIKRGITQIKCEEFLQKDTKEYQRYNIRRSLPHIMDGLNPSRRKIVCAGRKYFANRSKSEKVATFAGEVVKTMNYHHGEASLHSTITKLGQEFVGSNVLPLFKGNSVCIGFGSRKTGGRRVGAPRYIKLKLNKSLTNLLFPKDDDWLLKYIFEEGERSEPEYFVPILPMAIIENIKLPAHGWEICSWGRNVMEVIANVRKLITGEIDKPEPMNINEHKWNGDLVYKEDKGVTKLFSVGKYKYNRKKNTITITELPHGVFSELLIEGNRKKEIKKRELFGSNDGHFKQFIKGEKSKVKIKPIANTGEEFEELERESKEESQKEGEESKKEEDVKEEAEERGFKQYRSLTIRDKPVVDSVLDDSKDDKINIVIKLKRHGYQYIKHLYKEVEDEWDPVIEYFHLRKVIYDNLSFLNEGGDVKVYKKYETIMMKWFKERKKLYVERINRRIIILRLQIELRESKNMFAANFDEYNLSKKKESIWEEKLTEKDYQRYNESVVINPRYIPIDKIIYFAKEDADVSYSYIYDLTQKHVMDEAIQKRKDEIKEMKKELKRLTGKWKHFKGDSAWISELDSVENVIEKGTTLGWNFDEEKIVYT